MAIPLAPACPQTCTTHPQQPPKHCRDAWGHVGSQVEGGVLVTPTTLAKSQGGMTTATWGAHAQPHQQPPQPCEASSPPWGIRGKVWAKGQLKQACWGGCGPLCTTLHHYALHAPTLPDAMQPMPHHTHHLQQPPNTHLTLHMPWGNPPPRGSSRGGGPGVQVWGCKTGAAQLPKG